jgi:hypothetical protein
MFSLIDPEGALTEVVLSRIGLCYFDPKYILAKKKFMARRGLTLVPFPHKKLVVSLRLCQVRGPVEVL